jgi:TolB-like protein/AraC-like DNA-binding protein
MKLFRFIVEKKYSTISARQIEFLSKIEKLIAENLNNEKFGIEDLASDMNMSRTQIYRKVKKNTGKSISKFICEYRLRKAMELLNEKEATASEIAYKVGFNSPSYFSKCFHNFYGYAPGEIRKKKHLPSNKKGRKQILLTIGILMIVSIIIALYTISSKKSTDTVISIAVLAFNDQSPNGDHEWLGDGVADEILNILTQVEDLKVIGKTSSFSFKNKGATIKEIGEALEVNVVLEGSVSKIGDRLRITAQLIDVESEAHIWSDKYDRDAADIFLIIDEVAQNLVGSLLSELSFEEVEEIKMVYQPKAEAYAYFIKAEYIHEEWLINRINDDGFVSAREMYLKAISTDPDYMDAVAGLANLYDSRAWKFNTKVNRTKRDSILNVAYHIDPQAPYVLYLKGFVNNNLDSAFYFLKKAYDLDPYNKGSGLLLNRISNLGLYDICIPLCYKYLARDPLNLDLREYLVSSLWNTGRIDDAREQLMKGLELREDHVWLNMLLFYMKVFVDQDTIEANRIYEKLAPSYDQVSIESKALLLAMEGKKEEALKVDSVWRVKLRLNMKTEALASIAQIINRPYFPGKDHYYGYLSLKGHIFYESIRDEPQFQQWLKETKLVYDERMRKYGHLFNE